MAEEQGGLEAFDELSKARAALLAQQNKLVDMLEERSKPSSFDFYSNLARGFNDPNAKSFSQGLGSAVGNLQQEDERQKGKELQMYQIRSQLAQSQYELQKQNAMARQLQSEMFGSGKPTTSDDALKIAQQAGLRAGPTTEAASLIGAPSQQRQTFDSLDNQTKRMILIQAQTDPAKAIESLAKMGIEIGTKNAMLTDVQKNFNSALQMLPEEVRPYAQNIFAKSQTVGKSEDALAGIAALGASLRKGEISPEIFQQGMQALQSKLNLGKTAPSISSSVSPRQASSELRGTPQEVFAQLGSIEDPVIRKEATEAYLRQLDAKKQSTGQSGFPASIVPQTPLTYDQRSGLPILSPADIAAVEVKKQESAIAEGVANRTESNKPFITQQATISNFSPIQVSQNKSRLNELEDLVKRNPEVVGLMVRQGPMYALMQAAESGVTTPFGSISVPVSEALAKLKLNPAQQAVARNITQIISDLNQQVMKEGKNIFGPAISTYDAQKMAEPGFKNTDPASFIMYLANKHKVTNHFMGEMNDALNEYRDKNPDAGANKFFTDKSSPYKRIVSEFTSTYNDLVKNRSPYR